MEAFNIALERGNFSEKETLEDFILKVANYVDLDHSIVFSVILIMLAKMCGKRLTLAIKSQIGSEDNICDQIQLLLNLFEWSLAKAHPRITTHRVNNKAVQEGFYFMRVLQDSFSTLTVGKKETDITINSVENFADFTIKLAPIPFLAVAAPEMNFSLPSVMGERVDNSIFTDEPSLIRIIAEICACFTSSKVVEYNHISEAERIVSYIQCDYKVLQTPKTSEFY